MRVMERHREEDGATAVIVAILLLVLVGALALTVDGGLLWTKYRLVRNANDAAALAAAYSCASGEGMGAAETNAGAVASANVADAALVEPNEYKDGTCLADGGEVTVHFGGEQTLLFGPAIGVSSPKPVVADATAAWGGAGGATNVAPLMLSKHRLSDCDIPDGELIEGVSRCFFWWDNGTPKDTTALTNAEWGLVDLTTWGVQPWETACEGNVSQSDVGTWIADGYPGALIIDPSPEYVCRGSGFQGNAFNNDVNDEVGQILFFPVNDPAQQVQRGGALCRPDGVDGACSVYMYAIVGFAALEIVHVWTGNDAQEKCNHPADNNGSIRCLEAVWEGFQPGGLLGGSGSQNYGIFAVALTS